MKGETGQRGPCFLPGRGTAGRDGPLISVVAIKTSRGSESRRSTTARSSTSWPLLGRHTTDAEEGPDLTPIRARLKPNDLSHNAILANRFRQLRALTDTESLLKLVVDASEQVCEHLWSTYMVRKSEELQRTVGLHEDDGTCRRDRSYHVEERTEQVGVVRIRKVEWDWSTVELSC